MQHSSGENHNLHTKDNTHHPVMCALLRNSTSASRHQCEQTLHSATDLQLTNHTFCSTTYKGTVPAPAMRIQAGRNLPGIASQFATQNPGFATQNPGFATQNPGFATQNPGFATQNPGFAMHCCIRVTKNACSTCVSQQNYYAGIEMDWRNSYTRHACLV